MTSTNKQDLGQDLAPLPRSADGHAAAEPSPGERRDLELGSTYAAPVPAAIALPSEALFALSSTTEGEACEPAPEVQPGTLINRYMVLSRLGEGGMGVVYAAFDTKLERKIAIKILHQQAALGSTAGRARMLREAQVLAQLAHPNVVAIFDVGIHNGQVFIGMEFLDGGTLSEWGSKKRREPAEILALYLQAGQGLVAAHAAHFIHRDFKPDNVLLGKDGRVRVTDFGVARVANQDAVPVRPNLDALLRQLPTSDLYKPLTTADTLIGTPLYMAPEQFDGRPVDARTDQFSFCVALYESLYGERPFAGNTLQLLYRNILNGKVRPPPPHSRVPGWVRAIVLRGLSAEPAARYPNMEALLQALGRDPRAVFWRRALAVGTAALLLGLGSAAASVATRPSRDPCLLARQRAEARLSGLWDGSVKSRISSVLASRSGNADAVWQKLSSSLDDYTQQWVDMQHEVCIEQQRRHPPPQLALRTLCLDLRHSQLGGLAPMLARPTPQSVGNALAAVWSLPPLRSCMDGHALESLQPLLAHPGDREAVTELTQKLAAVRVTEPGSDYRALLASARAIEARARSIDYLPLQAESLLVLGSLQQQGSDRAGASRSLTQAAVDGLASGQLAVATEAFARLVSLTAMDKKFDLAETYVQLAGATLSMLGRNDLSQARLLHAQGDLAAARFRFDEALRLHDQALALRQSLDRAHPDLAESHGKRAFVLRRMHRNEEALAAFAEALAIFRVFFDNAHPRVALTLRWQATTLADCGRLKEARALLEEVLKMQQQAPAAAEAPGADQELTLRELGRVHYMLGEYEVAADYAAQALSRAVPGKEAGAATMRARALLRLGRLAEARAAAELAQESCRKLLGPQSPEYAEAAFWLASTLLLQGDVAQALRLHSEVLAIREKQSDPLDRASSLIATGAALTASKQAPAGLPLIDQALALLASTTKDGFSYHRQHLIADGKVARASALYELARHRKTPELLALLSEAQSTYADPRTPDPYQERRLASWPTHATARR
jgi:serine/threonine-protein kinase